LDAGNTGTLQQYLDSLKGTAGSNGSNSLIKTTIELAGTNCVNGGTKIEVGLDSNLNGVLDANEVNVSQTKYVCNGETGPQGPAGSSNVTIGSNASYSDSEFTFLSSQEGTDGVIIHRLSNNGKYFIFSNASYDIYNSNFQTSLSNVGKVWIVKYENGVFEKIGQDFIGTYANQSLGNVIGINGDGTKIFFTQKESNLTDFSFKIYNLINNNWVLNSTILNPIGDSHEMNESGNLIIAMKGNYPYTTNYSDLIIYTNNSNSWNVNQYPLTGIRGGQCRINQNGDYIMVSNSNQTLDVSGGLNGRTAVYNYNGSTLTQVGGFIEGPTPLAWGSQFCISNNGLKIGISTGFWNTSLGNNTSRPVFIKTFQYNLASNTWNQYNNDLVFSSGLANNTIHYINFNNNSEEILTAIKNNNTSLSLKHYYVRYRSLNNNWNQLGSIIYMQSADVLSGEMFFKSNILSYSNYSTLLRIKDFN
jgi:hypothetical protein